MPQGRLLRQDDVTADTLKATATKKLDKDMFSALTGENGPLPTGALPSVKAATEQGQKAVLAALDDESKTVQKAKKQTRKAEDKEPEKVTPKTPLEWGISEHPSSVWNIHQESRKCWSIMRQEMFTTSINCQLRSSTKFQRNNQLSVKYAFYTLSMHFNPFCSRLSRPSMSWFSWIKYVS